MENYHKDCIALAEKVRKCDFKAIYAIPTGGLVAGAIIAKHLNIPVIQKLDDDLAVYDVLVVDDMVNSGKTLKCINYKFRTAVVYVNKRRCKYYPDFFVHQLREPFVLPYNKQLEENI